MMAEPSARAMKRGVPPTARKARTGELTPPGMTFWARAKSDSLLMRLSMHLARSRRLAFLGPAFGAGPAFFTGRQSPEEAIGNDVAHAGAEARVQRLVEEGERLADGHVQFAAGGQQRRQRGRQGVAGANEADLEAL